MKRSDAHISRKQQSKPRLLRSNLPAGTLKYIAIGIVLAATLVLLYLLSVRLDREMNERGLQAAGATGEDGIDAGEFGYARGTLYFDESYGNGEDDEVAYNYYHNFENYLIMGTDIQQNVDNPGMADFLLLMSIDKTDDTYSLLEINRDTIAEISLLDQSGHPYSVTDAQICMAHSYAPTCEEGCRNQIAAVSNLLGGLPISGYYTISMDDIGKVNHAFGGVTVTLTEDLTHLDPEMEQGATLTLTDEQAEKYLRARMGTGEGTNAERMDRQRTYLQSLIKEGETKVRESARHYYRVFEEMESFANTSLTGKQISRIAKALTQNDFQGFFSFDGQTEYGDDYIGDGQVHAQFYPDQDSVVGVMTDIFGLVGDQRIAGYGSEGITEEDFEGITEDEHETVNEA